MYLWYAIQLGLRCLLDKFTLVMLVQYSRMASLWCDHTPTRNCSTSQLRAIIKCAHSTHSGLYVSQLASLEMSHGSRSWTMRCSEMTSVVPIWRTKGSSKQRYFTFYWRNFTSCVGLHLDCSDGVGLEWGCTIQERLWLYLIWISIFQFYNFDHF